MNALPPDVLQFPNLKTTYPSEAIPVLVSTLLAMARVVDQKSDFKREKPVLGEMEYGYPKGPGGPLICFFDSVKFPHFGGSFKRKADTNPWNTASLLITNNDDPHPVNVTPAFYEHALGLAFDKSLRHDPPSGYADPSVNKFYFHAKDNPHIQYIFTATLDNSSLNEQFPQNFKKVNVVNTNLDR